MTEFQFRTGEELTLWVRDRSSLSAFYATTALHRSLSRMEVPCSVRGCSHLSEFSLCLTKGNQPSQEPNTPSLSSREAFRISIDGDSGIRLNSGHKRGLTYGVWRILEQLGWSWPTPSLERVPERTSWSLNESSEIFEPALRHRIVFLEEVQVTPEMLLWFSRQRFNTLFPSNPTRFSDPEKQFSDGCMIRARELGLDFILGGHWWDWFAADLEMGEAERSIPVIADRAWEVWEGLGDPNLRLAIWPTDFDAEIHLRLIDTLSEKEESMRFETEETARLNPSIKARTLFRLGSSCSGIHPDLNTLNPPNGLDGPAETYGLLSFFSDDGSLGYSVSPFLCWRMLEIVHQGASAGVSGMALEFKSLPLSRFLESSAFAVALVGRAMWEGQAEMDPAEVRRVLDNQFDSVGGIVHRLMEDLGLWISDSRGSADGPLQREWERIELASEILQTERMRDKLDERISEIEESPPSEPSLELARSLTTLVHLYDLEQSEDVHEATATARTIWKKNDIDNWPDWLRKSSPLVERLEPFL